MTGIEVSLDRLSLIVEHPKQKAVVSRLLGLETDFHGLEFARPDIKTLGTVAWRQQQVIERWNRTIVQIWRGRTLPHQPDRRDVAGVPGEPAVREDGAAARRRETLVSRTAAG